MNRGNRDARRQDSVKRSAVNFYIDHLRLMRAADDAVRVVPESDLKSWWQPDPAHPSRGPEYPLDALKNHVEGCVAVAMEIHADGSVSNERVWRSELPEADGGVRKQLEQVALLSAHQWRFVPVSANVKHDPVYTYQIVTYTLTGSSPKWTDYDQQRHDKLEAKCKTPNFPQQVQAMITAAASAKGGTQ